MAAGSWDLTPRTVPDAQDAEDPMKIVLRCFRERKVLISYAIKKSFPFLEALRDRELITNKMYEDCQESFKSLIPVSQVIYKVLNELEKKFDMEVLEALFSEINRMEYPDLMNVYKDFQNGPTLPENRLTDHPREREQVNGLRTQKTREKNGTPGSHQTNCQTADKSALLGTETHTQAFQVNSCSVVLVDIKKEKPFYSDEEQQTLTRVKRSQASDIIVISSDDSGGLSDGDEVPTASRSALRNEPEISTHDPLESSEDKETQEATCSHKIKPKPREFRDSPTFRKSPLKRGREHVSDSSESSEEETLPVFNFWKRSDWRGGLHATGLSNGDSAELNHREERSEALRSGSGAELQGPGNKCSCVICSSECVPGGQEARTDSGHTSSMTDAMRVENHSVLGNDIGKRRTKKRHTCKIKPLQKHKKKYKNSLHLASCSPDLLPGRKRGRSRLLSAGSPRKRGWPKGPRIFRETHVNFHVPELPVTCGNARGTLIKDLFKHGIWKKSIQSEDGRWFTPREFEIEGNYAPSKNWKLSLRCHGWKLKELLEKGYLPEPPSKKGKRRTPDPPINIPADPYPENSNECEVCSQGGQLYCCDTCPKSYHEHCHIPSVDTKRDPWSCVFCKTEAIRKRCRDSQPCLQESEVLMKEMSDEDQLKCELLLLKVYCYAIKDATLGQQERMDLSMIKVRLREEKYFRVKEFVQDIRLIFQSHKACGRNKKINRLGLGLEAKFEKNFKNIFGVKETTPHNDPLSHLGPFSSQQYNGLMIQQ
ncbi:nuclear autoantigen Sp-100 [Octodon degus]|uniref:Nuclear autoantigen Sp-100 n=1 Tax=Octodon degus TaxID=10160 RepID=A0A6P6F072_OCTDE|nr:nuclear autoantigen Sp-100 [Octodon degus]